MSLKAIATLEIIEIMEGYVERNRPPEKIRNKLDIGYRIDNQSVYIFEIRPDWLNPKIISEYDFAKATYIIRQDIWKVYWMRSNLKWFAYDPKPEVKKLSGFIKLVDEDKHGCFKG